MYRARGGAALNSLHPDTGAFNPIMPGPHKTVANLNGGAAAARHCAVRFVLPNTYLAVNRAWVNVAWGIANEVTRARRTVILHRHFHSASLLLLATSARKGTIPCGAPIRYLAIHRAWIAFTILYLLGISLTGHPTVRRLNFRCARPGALSRTAIRIAIGPLLPTVPLTVTRTGHNFTIRLFDVLSKTLEASVVFLHLDFPRTLALAITARL